LTPNPLINPGRSVGVFGKITQKLRNLLAPETETKPLELSYGTDAEARGFGDSLYPPDTISLSAWAFDKMRLEAGRFAAIRDYELMDGEQPEISNALDVISEFSTQSDDPKAETFSIHSDDEELQTYLMEKAKELKLDKYVTPTAREVAKYGCSFWELVADETGTLVKVKTLVNSTMMRNETKFGDLLPEAFSQIDPKTQKEIAHFASWQIVHGRYHRMSGRPYGNSLLEPARAVFKKLQLMEDGLVIGRLYRSHMRYVFSIPVDGMSADQAETYLDKIKAKFRKRSRWNTGTQKLEGFDSPIAADDDFFIGVRKEGVPAKVETVQGQGGQDQMADIEYFQNKLFSALKVPKALLGFERDINAKATLTEQDVNFARTLRRMQQVIAEMVVQTLTVAMILDGIDPGTVEDWNVVMPPVSTTDELRKWQTEALKANVALIYGQKLPIVDKEYIWKQIMELSPDELERLAKLDPEELGIQTMPSPPFENVGELEAEFGNQPGGGGGAPQEERFIELESAIGDAAIVRKIRNQLLLPESDPVTDEELHLVRLLRDFHEMFGAGDIDEAVLETAFTKAKNSRNGSH
jgi:hypothetical protein